MSSQGLALLGIPGAGKTTITQSLGDLLNQIRRPFKTINLDPASFQKGDFDIKDTITCSDVQQFYKIGPNASMNYCLDFLENNIQILQDFIITNKDYYFLFDIPGQVESYVAHDSLKKIFKKLEINLGIVFVIDGTQCLSYSKFISLCLQMTAVICSFPYPFIPILNKVDLLSETDRNRIMNFFNYENDNQIQMFAIRQMMDFSIQSNAYEIKDIAMILQEVDSRIGYIRGTLGEYSKLEKAEYEEIESFMNSVYE